MGRYTAAGLGLAMAAALTTGCVSGGGGDGSGGSDGGTRYLGNGGGLGGSGSGSGGGSAGGGGTVSTSVPRSTPITEVTEAQARTMCADLMRAAQSQISERQLCTFIAIQGAAEDANTRTGGAGDEPEPDPAPTPAECQAEVDECSQFIGQVLTPALCDEGEIEQADLPEHCAALTVGDLADCMGASLAFMKTLGQGLTCNDIGRADELAFSEEDAPDTPAACARIDEICPELNEDEDEAADVTGPVGRDE